MPFPNAFYFMYNLPTSVTLSENLVFAISPLNGYKRQDASLETPVSQSPMIRVVGNDLASFASDTHTSPSTLAPMTGTTSTRTRERPCEPPVMGLSNCQVCYMKPVGAVATPRTHHRASIRSQDHYPTIVIGQLRPRHRNVTVILGRSC